MAPAVSVLVPCRDHGRYLDEAIGSVLAQTFDDFEILVVDDGSTDPASTALLADYRRPRTRVLRTPPRGLAAARNLALAESAGRYVCALDADDRLAPGYLARTVAVLEADPGLAFVSTWLRMFGDEEGLWRPERCDLVALLAEDTVHTAALARRAAVEAVGGWDGAMGVQGYEDWDLWLSIVERGGRGVILPEVLFEYRRRADSMSAICSYGEGHVRLMDYMLRKHAASYRAHLFDVLRLKEAEVAHLMGTSRGLEDQVETWLAPGVASLRAEAARLGARRAAVEAAAARRRAAEAEVAALRASWSWRLTAPLRAVYDLLRRRE
jgi:glycosyltransferase involved in cell wall biosynthesis